MPSSRLHPLLLAFIVVVLAACGTDPSGVPTPTPIPPGPEVEQATYTVQRGTVVHQLTFTARVAPVQEATLFFRADGFLSRLLVQRNARVKAGDLLAELEGADLQRELDAARLDWQQAQLAATREMSRTQLVLQEKQLALDAARAADPDPAVLQAELAFTRAREALQFAQDENRKAQDRPWEPQEVRDAYARQVTEAERELNFAQAAYDAAVQDRNFRIRQLQLAVAQARLDYETALDGANPRLEQRVQQLEAQLTERQIVAPFAGVVLSIAAAPGDRVEAFRPVLIAGDPSSLELRAELSPDEIQQMAAGQPAALFPTDFPGQSFDGRVRQLPFGFGGDVEETDRSVRIAPGPGAPELALGSLVRVTIVIDQKDGALWLPPPAIQTFQGRKFVIVLETGGTQRRVDVVTGIEADDRVEIVSGLSEGQTVVGP